MRHDGDMTQFGGPVEQNSGTKTNKLVNKYVYIEIVLNIA